jgi:hypothetical protein
MILEHHHSPSVGCRGKKMATNSTLRQRREENLRAMRSPGSFLLAGSLVFMASENLVSSRAQAA